MISFSKHALADLRLGRRIGQRIVSSLFVVSFLGMYATRAGEIIRFRADDSNLETDATGHVLRWPNQTGNLDNALPQAGFAGPLHTTSLINGNTKPVVRFNGSEYLEANGSVPPRGSLFAVIRHTDAAAVHRYLFDWGNEGLCCGAHGVVFWPLWESSGNSIAIFRNNDTYGDIVGAQSLNVWETITLTWGTNGTTYHRNGGMPTSALVGQNDAITSVSTTPDLARLGIGGPLDLLFTDTTLFKGEIAELRAYDTQLNETQRAAIEAELYANWFTDELSVLGDTNADGVVDLSDLNNVRNTFGQTSGDPAGDTDGDGTVDIDDLNNVRNHFGESIGGQAVPEPGTLLLAWVAIVGALFVKRARRLVGRFVAHAGCLAIIVVSSAQARSAEFFGLGNQLSTEAGIIDVTSNPTPFDDLNLSHDGAVVVGTVMLPSGQYEAFRWTRNSGMTGLGDLAGGPFHSRATGVSADGSVVVGVSTSFQGEQAARWRESDGLYGLGDLPDGNFLSGFTGISGDGLVAVGDGDNGTRQAIRWTSDPGIVGLGYLPGGGSYSTTNNASADGSVVVGCSDSFLAEYCEAFRWTMNDGLSPLGDLPGGGFISDARATSADGSIVVGFGQDAQGFEAFRWTSEAGMQPIGRIPGHVDSRAESISADGSTIVGLSRESSGSWEPFVWRAESGMRSLSDVLADDYDLQSRLAGWTLLDAKVSGHGRAFVGHGMNPDGQFETWLSLIDSLVTPGDTNADGVVDLTDLNNVRNTFGQTGGNPAGDTNGDSTVDVDDLNNVRNHFGETAAAAAAVPEPGGLALAALAVILGVAAARYSGRSSRRRRFGSDQCI